MTIREKILKEIRERIVLGKFAPGERLVEAELCEEFGVSRGPIREALTQLSKEGFVNLVPNRGAVVAKISAQEIEDYYILLALLERKAVEWATPQIRPRELEILMATNEALARCMSLEDENRLRGWSQNNLAFHGFFWNRCGNEKLGWVIEEIRQRVFRYRYTSLMVTSYEEYLQDHEAIIEAVKGKDAARAGQCMEDHIIRALNVLKEFFSQMPNY